MAEEQTPEEAVEAEAGVDTSPAALSIALDGARHDPGLREDIRAFLAHQTRLIEDQRHHLKEQYRQLRLRRWIERLKLLFQAGAAAIGLTILGLIGWLVVDATGAHGLVFDGVTAPPSLAARGLTSQGLAESLVARLDRVREVANANSVTRTDEVEGAEEDAIKLEVPETGVSLTEVRRWLRRTLGHETHVSVALRDDGDGRVALVLTAPGGDPLVVEGASADIDKVLQTGAELVFQRFDPGNYVLYLNAVGRPAEAYRAALANTRLELPRRDLADAYSLLSSMDLDPLRALARNAIAIQLDPTFMMSWEERAVIEGLLGHDEARLAALRRLAAVRFLDQPRDIRPGYATEMRWVSDRLDETLANYASLGDPRPRREVFSAAFAERGMYAAWRHDLRLARRELALDAASTEPAGADDLADARWALDAAAGDWPQALHDARDTVAGAEAAIAAASPEGMGGRIEARLNTLLKPRLALAEALTGDLAAARAEIEASPPDCYVCVQVRGRTAEAAGDHAGADRWFAEAVRQGPSLPAAYLEWGRIRLARGDAAGALGLADRAVAVSPRDADAIELQGEALLAKGAAARAADRFAAAADLAPGWGRLQLKWGEALARAGRSTDGRARLQTAAGLDLTAADLRELQRLK